MNSRFLICGLGILDENIASELALLGMDIPSLLRRHEGKTLEFKRDLSSPPGVLRTLVAFANPDDRMNNAH